MEPGAHKLIKEYHNQHSDSAPWEIKAQALILDDNTDFNCWKFHEIKYSNSTLQVQLDRGKIPTWGSIEAAGFDLHFNQNTIITANKTVAVSTGI